MSDSGVLDKFLSRIGDDGQRRPAGEREQADELIADLGCFGWLRGIRDRAIMLELRKRDGSILAISYGWLERAEFDPSEGITLYSGSRRVRIKGRHLNAEVRPHVRLFEGIVRHRVPWIRQSPGATFGSVDSMETVVDGIE